MVDRMPDGLDTVVHERGQTLSSGERQLLALARAFLAHPRVLVLDEATSNLDLQSETKIENALDVLLENRTAILIAHRLSTAMRADRIVVVDLRPDHRGGHPRRAGGGRAAATPRCTPPGCASPSWPSTHRPRARSEPSGRIGPRRPRGQPKRGRRSAHGQAVSSWAATRISWASRHGPATIWTPTGSPDAASAGAG